MANKLAKLAQFQAFEPWRGAPGLPMPVRSNDNQRSAYAARARQWACAQCSCAAGTSHRLAAWSAAGILRLEREPSGGAPGEDASR